MNDDTEFALKALASALSFLVVVFAAENLAAGVACHDQWKRSGFGVDYSFMQGCMISTEDGKWIPAENYREVR